MGMFGFMGMNSPTIGNTFNPTGAPGAHDATGKPNGKPHKNANDKFSLSNQHGPNANPEKKTGFRGFAEGLKNGLVNMVKSIFTVPGALITAGTIGLVAATGGAALIPLALVGLGVGGYQVGKGIVKGDAEQVGEGVFTLGSSLLGAKFTPNKIGGQTLQNSSLWGKLKAPFGGKNTFANSDATFLGASKDATVQSYNSAKNTATQGISKIKGWFGGNKNTTDPKTNTPTGALTPANNTGSSSPRSSEFGGFSTANTSASSSTGHTTFQSPSSSASSSTGNTTFHSPKSSASNTGASTPQQAIPGAYPQSPAGKTASSNSSHFQSAISTPTEAASSTAGSPNTFHSARGSSASGAETSLLSPTPSAEAITAANQAIADKTIAGATAKLEQLTGGQIKPANTINTVTGANPVTPGSTANVGNSGTTGPSSNNGAPTDSTSFSDRARNILKGAKDSPHISSSILGTTLGGQAAKPKAEKQPENTPPTRPTFYY